MTKIQRLEREIEELTPDELAAFRKWFQEYDAAAWDEQIEQDAAAGRLDKLAEKALEDHKAGKDQGDSKHLASPDFWSCYRQLPKQVQQVAVLGSLLLWAFSVPVVGPRSHGNASACPLLEAPMR